MAGWGLAGVAGRGGEQMASQLLVAMVCTCINSYGFFIEGHLQLNQSYGETINREVRKLCSQEEINNWKRKPL